MAKDPNRFVIYSTASATVFARMVLDHARAHPGERIEYKWKIGDLASMEQKALIHIWFRTWVAHVHHKREEDVTKEEVEGMKRWVKAAFYHETAAEFMVERVPHPFKPDKTAIEYTSVADWSPSECHQVMTWMQARAADGGLILESIGEYQTMKQSSTR